MSDISKLSKLAFFQVGKYEYDTQHICDYQSIPRPHHCMGLIIEGSADFEFGNETVNVKKGDIIFVPVGSTYISKWSGSPDVLYISAHFSFESPTVFPRERKMKIQKITLPDFEELCRIYTDMYSGCNGDKATQFSVLGLFYSLIGRIHPMLVYTSENEVDERIKRAIEYVEDHCTEDFPTEILAKISNMSMSHFYANFKKHTGLSPIEYKHIICIRRAELMLLDGKKRTVEEISETLGFNSSIYFREVFKKITGKTPNEYRKLGIE